MGILARLKRHAGDLNYYFGAAVRACVCAEDEAAGFAAFSAGVVAASLQRASMVNYLRGMSADLC